jgi:hypothetical protein
MVSTTWGSMADANKAAAAKKASSGGFSQSGAQISANVPGQSVQRYKSTGSSGRSPPRYVSEGGGGGTRTLTDRGYVSEGSDRSSGGSRYASTGSSPSLSFGSSVPQARTTSYGNNVNLGFGNTGSAGPAGIAAAVNRASPVAQRMLGYGGPQAAVDAVGYGQGPSLARTALTGNSQVDFLRGRWGGMPQDGFVFEGDPTPPPRPQAQPYFESTPSLDKVSSVAQNPLGTGGSERSWLSDMFSDRIKNLPPVLSVAQNPLGTGGSEPSWGHITNLPLGADPKRDMVIQHELPGTWRRSILGHEYRIVPAPIPTDFPVEDFLQASTPDKLSAVRAAGTRALDALDEFGSRSPVDRLKGYGKIAKAGLAGIYEGISGARKALAGEPVTLSDAWDTATAMAGFGGAVSRIGLPPGVSGGNTTGMFLNASRLPESRAVLPDAIALENRGHTPESIHHDTGLFRGADGVWRTEIDDSTSKLTDAVTGLRLGEEANAITTPMPILGGLSPYFSKGGLRDILDHPELYRAYGRTQINEMFPHTRVLRDNVPPEGLHNPSIGFTNLRAGSLDDIKRVLAHEVQHGVSNRDGLSSGFSDEFAEAIIKGTTSNARQIGIARKLAESSRQDAGVFPAVAARARSMGVSDDTIALAKQFYDDPEHGRRELDHATNWLINMGPDAYRLYERIAGEVEARNTANRMDFTPEKRRASFPGETQDIPFSEQIVAYPDRFVPNASDPLALNPLYFSKVLPP